MMTTNQNSPAYTGDIAAERIDPSQEYKNGFELLDSYLEPIAERSN